MWLHSGEICYSIGYPIHSDGVGTYGATIVASATPYTKGTFVSMINSTPFDGLLYVQPFRESAAGRKLIDIGIGVTGDVLWENLPNQATSLGYRSNFNTAFSFPTLIPQGSVVRARCSASTGSTQLYLKAYLLPLTHDRLDYPSIVHTYGADTASCEGLAIDPGGTVETKGDYTEITSATTHPYQGFRFALSVSNEYSIDNYTWHLDIALGAASSEQVIISNYRASSGSTHDQITPRFSPIFPITIPEGTRVAARASCSGNDSLNRMVDIIFYGIG